jgi:BirA family transcriptional regulator, biotin operon repressor / biotin---[acetyl-CoA-carboxylase] ligase
VRHVTETASTNSDLLAALDAGLVSDRTVLVADHQTAGRGRLGRRWDAPPGANLLVSIAFVEVPAHPAELTHRVGLAAVDAVRRFASERPVALKWPNDVLLDGRKLGGILAQRSGRTGGVVVGLGLNISWAPTGAARLAPDDTPDSSVSPAALTAELLDAFDRLPTDIFDRYRHTLATLGSRVRVELPAGVELVGTATSVDESGRLTVVDDDGAAHVVDAGDVIHATVANG